MRSIFIVHARCGTFAVRTTFTSRSHFMRINFAIIVSAACVLASPPNTQADKASNLKPLLLKSGTVSFEDDFSGQELGPKWIVNKGSWTVQDGSVVGREKKEDMHAAVLTLQHPHRDSIVQFSFRLNGATGFNLSINHSKGHLFRVAVNPTGLVVTKDKDKKNSKSKVMVLGKGDGTFAVGQWYSMLVEMQGDQVAVQTDNGLKVEVREPSLNVDKPGYRFVMRNESLGLDDVRVWMSEQKR
jgi:hypothetical protein